VPPVDSEKTAHVLLQRRNQVGNDLERHDDLGAHRRLDGVVGLGGLDVALGERQDLAETRA
jgi:hypothetical protein